MAGPETRVDKKIIDALTARGAYVEKIHGSEYQNAGIPDLVGFIDGFGFGIEVKNPKKKASAFKASEREAIASLRAEGVKCGSAGGCTKLQASRIRRIIRTGNKAGVATSVDEALDILFGE